MIYTLTLNPALDRELQVPSLAFDSVLRAEAVRLDFGGKGFNVSRMLQALGAESVAVGLIGGLTGQRLQTGLAKLGIMTDFVSISGETRTNISIVSHQEKRHLKVNEAGPTIHPAEAEALLEKVISLVQPGDWWVLAGSLPPGLPADTYAGLVNLIQTQGAQVIVDTSGASLQAVCSVQPYFIKPNAAEASELTGIAVDSTESAIRAAQHFHALGIQQVMISLGKAGAILSVDGHGWVAHPPHIQESNPIGAGDSAVGGLVYGLSQALPWPDVLRWSMACGAATASLPGTTVGSRDLVTGLLESVRIEAQL